MASLDSDKVSSALKDKMGCVEERGNDHIRYVLWEGDKILSRTKISPGPKHTIGDVLISKMSRQLRLGTSANFVAMVQCTKDKQDCLAIIRAATS